MKEMKICIKMKSSRENWKCGRNVDKTRYKDGKQKRREEWETYEKHQSKINKKK